MTYTVKYHIATYSGTVTVNADDNADSDQVIALAKKKLRREAGEFPIGAQSWRIIEGR